MITPVMALTWTPQTIDSIGSVGGYTSLVIDEDGLEHISYYDFSNGDLKYATGSGTTWVCQTVDSVGDVGPYTSLALNNAGNPSITYYDATKSDLKYAAWNGTSWNIQTIDSIGGVGQYTSLALNSAGNPSISYYDATNTNLKFASFNGIRWVNETIDSPGSVGSYTSLRLNKTGYPCISYFDTTRADLKYAEWNGGSWIIKTVDGPQQVGQYSSLSLNSSDYPAISYYDTTNGDLKYASWDGNTWINETVMSSGNVGMYTSLLFDKEDHPRIIFYDVTNADLKYAARSGTTWTTETPDSAGLTGYYSQLALDEDDFPHISYYDVTNGDLKFVLVYHPLIPGFSGTPLTGTGPLTVAFTDTTTGSPTSWTWYFGDGETSSLENPVHTYTSPGKYTVYLVVGNSHEGTSTTSRAEYITVNSLQVPLAPDFSASPTTGIVPITVQFHGSSEGLPDVWSWSFGDGGVGTGQNSSHSYVSAGTYTVALTVANCSLNSTRVREQYITVVSNLSSPLASFSGSPRTGTEQLVVQFNDTSTGAASSWAWIFGDGSSSAERNASHTYTSAGTYTVYLTATNEAGANTTSQHGYITVNTSTPVPVASFAADPVNGTAPLHVSFTDSSTGSPESWVWYFGDGETATDQNPSHIYQREGIYTVYLTVTNPGGSNITGRAGIVRVLSAALVPEVNFTGSPLSGNAPLAVSFNDESSNSPTSWSWNFGDGGSSSVQNPTYMYGSPGVYTVYLTTANAAGSSTRSRKDFITVSSVSSPAASSTFFAGADSDYSDEGPAPLKRDDLNFFVDSSYLEKHKIMPGDVRMMSFTGSGWMDIPTKYTGSSGNRFYFTSSSDHYSILAVGNVKEGISNLPELNQKGASPESSFSAHASSVASSVPDQKTLTDGPRDDNVIVQRTTNPPIPSPESPFVFNSPFMLIVAAAAGLMVIGGVWLIRRWWIRRQNPALFRKYD